MKTLFENIEQIEIIKKMEFKHIQFERGLGIIEPRFIILFSIENEELVLEVETNFRIRTSKDLILSFNDLYIDFKCKELSIRRFRNQERIEKTFLYNRIESINNQKKNSRVKKVDITQYGDLKIFLSNGLILECISDTHLNGAVLYRFIYKKDERIEISEVKIVNEKIMFEKVL